MNAELQYKKDNINDHNEELDLVAPITPSVISKPGYCKYCKFCKFW